MSIHSAHAIDPTAIVAGTGTNVRVRAGVLALALAVTLAWAFSLSRSLFDPIGYDQAMYQYMAERIMAGDRLYVDVWDQNGPGIVAIHWIATHLVGREPVSLRIFDAGWQLLTLLTLFVLATRDGRRHLTGWLACGLYVLAYYSMGYVQTAQREGFAVLPILLSVHLIIAHGSWVFVRGFAAGALSLFVFAIKPPLGLCFGGLWFYSLVRGWRERKNDSTSWLILAGMTVGFLAAAAAGYALLVHMGSWQAFLGTLTRRDMPGYIQGPRLIRDALPSVLVGAGAIWLITFGLLSRADKTNCGVGFQSAKWTGKTPVPHGLSATAAVLFGVLLTSQMWPGWQQILTRYAGLWIPAVGSILLCSWRGRSEIWRLCLLMLLAATGVLLLQGQFFTYHMPPMLAFAAYIAAVEISDRLETSRDAGHPQRVWLSVCIAAAISLAIGPWWSTMTMVTRRPYVLAGTTLANHYTSITKHKLSCPTYATTIKVAHRIDELTAVNEPIGLLMHEARIFHFARRPAVYKLIPVQDVYRHMFADYMQAIRSRRPKVLVARIPDPLRSSRDLQAIQAAVFEQTEAFFGPPGIIIRELYRATETIDDVCILQPR